jgi:hypothetical protein
LKDGGRAYSKKLLEFGKPFDVRLPVAALVLNGCLGDSGLQLLNLQM